MLLTPLLPSLIPLFGALICPLRVWSHGRWNVRRWLYMLFLALTGAGVVAIGLQEMQPLLEAPVVPFLSTALALLWTPLSLSAAGLLLAALLAGELVRRQRPMAPEHACLRLLLLAACMGVLAAGNLLVLSAAWSVHVLVLFLLRAFWRESAAEMPTPWEIWSSLLSTGLLVVGAVDVIAHQEGVLFLIVVQPGLALNALVAAVALRILSWPQAGGMRRNWEVFLISLVSGLYLWLRIGLALEARGPLVPGGTGVALLLAGLAVVSALHRRPGRALPYVLAHWLILALLAPLVDPDQGFVISLLIALHLVLSLLALRIHQTSTLSRVRLGRVPYVVAWASLGGLPLSLGLVAQWLLVRSCWEMGAQHLLFWVLLSYVANAVPAWTQARSLAEEGSAEPAASRSDAPALALAALAAIPLVVLGIAPSLLYRLWPQAPLDLSVLVYGRLLGENPGTAAPLVLITALGPLAAGLSLHPRFAGERASSLQPFYRVRRLVNAQWLYTAAREQVNRILTILGQGLEVLEGTFSLAWVLLWGVALVYLLVGG